MLQLFVVVWKLLLLSSNVKTSTTLPSLKGAKWRHKQKLFQFFEILPLHTTTTGQLA